MGSLLIKTSNSSELKLIRELLDKMKIKNVEISTEEKEDYLFGQMMTKDKTKKMVYRETIVRKLKAK